MSTPEKLCVFCVHFYISEATPGYSSWTPGTDLSMGCNKYVWTHDNWDDGTDTYRQNILRAETCEHYKDRDEVTR